MSKIRSYAMSLAFVLIAIVAIVPVWAYNSQSTGVAYSDPQFTSMYVTGAARVGGALTLGSTALTSSAAELNLLDGFSVLSTKSLVVAGGSLISSGSSNVATYSVSSVAANSLALWTRTSALTDASSLSLVVSNVRVSAANTVEVVTVNASDSAIAIPAATFSLLVIK